MSKLIKAEVNPMERINPSVADSSTQTSVADESTEIFVADKSIQISVADRSTAAKLRVQTEFNELDLPFNCEIKFPNGIDDLMTLEVTIRPYEGHYRHGEFVFSIEIPSCYPHKPPKVKCKTEIFHPNINYQGNVGLNILREDWVPVLGIKTVICGLYHIILEPNWEISLNEEAAKILVMDPELFDDLVQDSIADEDSDGFHI
ncbi:hypothetical protein V2J09_007174 [Rumex salicifolius]